MTRIRKTLTFSNVVAVIALFLALGGTVYAAGKINGKQIKSNSIPGNRLKSGSVTGKQIKSQSLTGKQIKGSSLSGVSAAALASVQYTVATVALPESAPGGPGNTGTATCPAGTKAIGGGATVDDDTNAFVNDSGPTSDRNGWTATGFSFTKASTMTITAICTAVTSATG